MGKKSNGILDQLMIDHELTKVARERAKLEGTSTDIIVMVKPPKRIKMEEYPSKEFLEKFNRPDATQKIRIKVGFVEREVASVMKHLSSRGETLEDIEKKTSDLMNSSRELYLATASCYVKIFERIKGWCISCSFCRLSNGKRKEKVIATNT